MRYPFLIIALVAIAAFTLGGSIMYMGTREKPVPEASVIEERQEAVAEETITKEPQKEDEKKVTEESTETKPEPVQKVIIAPPPPPPPQPATIIIPVIHEPVTKIITLPGGAVAEVDAQGNIIRYISGDPVATPPPPPPPPPEPEFKYSWCKKKVEDIVPNPGNYVVEMPSGAIAEFGREGLLFKYHCHPDGIIKP